MTDADPSPDQGDGERDESGGDEGRRGVVLTVNDGQLSPVVQVGPQVGVGKEVSEFARRTAIKGTLADGHV
ncbi:MAG: hypothetical protein EXR71_00655 [Myxococcales bacterium]|nr:hypothetical protein [Myxococcales bacterium]